ncbi:MAG: NYN domain-containing protein [Cyanobacteria bacterium P01_G01_bin.39]
MDCLSFPGDYSSQALSYSGALLLDVENFPLKLDLVKHLKPYCRYPISIKLAVANWQNASVAKLDKYLHQQGYQLIHVPKDKNAADAQILTLGASLQLNYSRVKDVVIVSQDFIFNYLHQTLQRQGCNTYQVYQQSGNVYVNDFTRDRSSLITQIAQGSLKSDETVENKIKTKIELTLVELIKKSTDKVTLSQLTEEFKRKYQHSVAETLKRNKLSQTPLDFIKQNCVNKIQVKASNSKKTHYLSLKSI